MTDADVRVLIEMVVYLDVCFERDGMVHRDSWTKQCADEERAALQRLIDEVGV